MMNDNENKKQDEIIIAATQKSNENLGITPEYTGNRSKLWDSTKSKNEFRDKQFGDKKTVIDSETGQVLHKSHKAAKRKYHQKDKNGNNVSTEWAKHAAEVDHKVALESLHEKTKYNGFLSDSDLKEIANQEYNYRLTSKSENASKGAQNVKDPSTHLKLQGDIAARTIKNAKGEFVQGALDTVQASAVSIVIDSVEQLLIEQKSVEETALNAGKAIAAAAVVGGTEKLIIDQATQIFAASGNEVLNNIVKNNLVGQLLVMASVVGQSLVRYIEGEIDEEELAEEILLNGACVALSTVITMAIPIPFVGAAVSMIAVSLVRDIYQTRKHMNDYLKKEHKIKALVSEAISAIEAEKKKFFEAYEAEKEQWNKSVDEGFVELLNSALNDTYSLEGMVSGLDKILSVCGTQAKFHSLDEYEAQMDMPLTLSI